MDPEEKNKIDQIIKLRENAHSYYSRKSKVYKSFVEMENNTYIDGAISKKNKELIAIGISVVTNCESCAARFAMNVLEYYRK